MKKYIKSVFLMGMVIFHSAHISASRDLGDLGRTIIREINSTYIQGIVGLAVSAAVLGGPENRDKIAKDIKLYFFPPKVTCIKHAELSLQPDVATKNALPQTIQEIAQKERESGTGHKFMLLYGKTGTGKSTLAKQHAYDQGADYYEITQSELDGYTIPSVIAWLDQQIYRIHKQTKPGEEALLHLEEFGKQLGTSSNAINNAKNTEFFDSWKKAFDKFKNDYKNVQIVGTTNFGSSDEPGEYNAAIMRRANLIEIDKPTDNACAIFLQSGCIAHLEKNGIGHATNQTTNHQKKMYLQEADINQPLRENFHVTQDMINTAATKRALQIKNTEKPWTIDIYLRPWLWAQTWEANETARKLKKEIYITPVITYDIKPTEEQINDFVQATQDAKNYEPLIEATEEARRNKLSQIKRMVDRTTNDASAEYKNPSNVYTVDPSQRSCTVTHQSGDYNEITKKYENAPKTITYNYGQVNASHIVLEAQRKKNAEIIESRPANTVSLQSTQKKKIESAQELIHTKDWEGLTRKLIIANDAKIKADIENSKEKRINKRAQETAQFKSTTSLDRNESNVQEFKKFKAKENTAATKIQSLARKVKAKKELAAKNSNTFLID